jgi:uncharacterized membrane protein
MTPRHRAFHPARLLHLLRSRPRLWLCLAFGTGLFEAVPGALTHHLGSRLLVAWNAGALLYLVLTGVMMVRSDASHMRRRALTQQEGRSVVLVLVVLASATVLYAIASQLATVKSLQGLQRTQHIGAAVLTIVTAWLFVQTTLAVQYAHDFYLARACHCPDPLVFPGTTDPTYLDFMYFACVIGTSGQTADVSFHGSALRGIGALHCMLAFFFNTTVLALTINIAAGLF